MRHFAVVGSGPAGFYTAEALEKAYGDKARVDILDRYPVPYGLIRFGVAPDHQSLKAVSKRYDKVAECGGVDFIGNVTVGRDVSVAEGAACAVTWRGTVKCWGAGLTVEGAGGHASSLYARPPEAVFGGASGFTTVSAAFGLVCASGPSAGICGMPQWGSAPDVTAARSMALTSYGWCGAGRDRQAVPSRRRTRVAARPATDC